VDGVDWCGSQLRAVLQLQDVILHSASVLKKINGQWHSHDGEMSALGRYATESIGKIIPFLPLHGG